jgi:hypothetical protein
MGFSVLHHFSALITGMLLQGRPTLLAISVAIRIFGGALETDQHNLGETQWIEITGTNNHQFFRKRPHFAAKTTIKLSWGKNRDYGRGGGIFRETLIFQHHPLHGKYLSLKIRHYLN